MVKTWLTGPFRNCLFCKILPVYTGGKKETVPQRFPLMLHECRKVVEVIVWLIESSSVICLKQAESIKLLSQFFQHGKHKIITENVNYCVFITSESTCYDADCRRTKTRLFLSHFKNCLETEPR